MDKQIVVYKHSNYPDVKRSEVLLHAMAWMNLKSIMQKKNKKKKKKLDTKGHILSDSMYVKYPEEVNP